MRWATRAGVHIDRAACAWLIRRHVDPDATFVFVSGPAAVPQDATPFDMRGLDVVLRGLSMVCDDDRVLELTAPIFDGLYEYHRRALLLDRPPA
ncbi:chromate resistance protein ChrB domain-containing protein [Paractinoplanes atraurantiacus]|uniref:Chromate resistance exported protein n=1 Tax=Paractinoplanes atraurantiacus TaxID=1036182 RepID=A0A285JUV6_9ACTN|nr:chromate resistance protein ChrB domain-containing protein [Actinoplanes atraurantiacus]SNY64112.1 Chromate resistance exported protein [Actinoplanes atraurantiacus]